MGLSAEDLGSRVRAARSYAKLSQQALADKLGLTRTIVIAIEDNDERHPLTVREAQQIAAVCSVPVNFLFEGWNVNRPIQDRLTDMERGLGELLRYRQEAQEQLRNFGPEEARDFLNLLQEVRARQGREVGRRELQSRTAAGQ